MAHQRYRDNLSIRHSLCFIICSKRLLGILRQGRAMEPTPSLRQPGCRFKQSFDGITSRRPLLYGAELNMPHESGAFEQSIRVV